MTQHFKLWHGDCLDRLQGLTDSSVDAVICDPPYDLTQVSRGRHTLGTHGHDGGLTGSAGGFMGKTWDGTGIAFDPKFWEIVFSKLKPGGVIKAFGGCYDEKTEVLTTRGWVFFPEVEEEDIFASLNPKTNLVEWLPAIEIVRQPHEGPMIQYRSNRVDLLVTPNHNMFLATQGHDFHLIRADSHPQMVRMKKDCYGRADMEETPAFVLPGTTISIGPGGMRDLPDLEIPWDCWLPFFGLWIAEGSASISHGATGSSTKIKLSHTNMKNLQGIKDLLAPWFDVKIYPHLDCACIHDKRLFNYLRPFGKAWEKFLPECVKLLPPRLLLLFMEWYIRGDGEDERWRAYTTSPRLRDDFQEIALYAGIAADWVEGRPKTPNRIKGRLIHSRRPCYTISFLRKQNQPHFGRDWRGESARTEISAQAWGGKDVYCVELPRNHTLYVRRNGKSVWCGNTRTFHKMVRAMRTAGFVDVKLEAWCFASGFPKSTNISKQIDRQAGAERQVIGTKRGVGGENMNDIVHGREIRQTTDEGGKGVGAYGTGAKQVAVDIPITAPATELAILWDGYGTALKPAWEVIVCGRKPK